MRNKCKHTRQAVLTYAPYIHIWCKGCGAIRLDITSKPCDYKRGKWESPKIVTDGYLIVS